MKINKIKKSYLNVSGEVYDSEFINLANVVNDKIEFDSRTLFLTNEEKRYLNQQKIKKLENVVYICKYKNALGVICDIPIEEYKNNKIVCHELVVPDVVQGMVGNLHGYNSEAAPVLLAYEEEIDFNKFIDKKVYCEYYEVDDIKIYAFINNYASEIIKIMESVNKLYVADGHHRLYTTSLCNFKTGVLSCLVNFNDLKISPIYRVLSGVRKDMFNIHMESIKKKFEMFPSHINLKKGLIRISYNNYKYVLKLNNLEDDAFQNNDIYRVNTQIISWVFRNSDIRDVKYVLAKDLRENKVKLQKDDVLIEIYPIKKEEFISHINKKSVMPPKSTCFYPKFPSFLILKKYK